MRALRPAPNKKAIIIDHVANNTRFSMIDDDIQWSLDPNELQGTGIAPIKTCSECGTENIPTGTRTCRAVIANRESILRCERAYNLLSIIYQTSTLLSRNGWLVLADYTTDLCLEFVDKTAEIISDKKVKRRRIAEIIQRPYRADDGRQLYQLWIKCLDADVSIREANISQASGDSFDTPVLCDADSRVLKYFLDQNGNLICGHIFNIRKTRIDEEGLIVKIYDSNPPAELYFNNLVETPSKNETPSTNKTSETDSSVWLADKQLALDGFEPDGEQMELDFQ